MIPHFTSVHDVPSVDYMIEKALGFKYGKSKSNGKNLTVAMIFFNPSLRTRMSTHKAAINLGMSVMSVNANESWQFEFESGAIMNGNSQEHIKDAVKVISSYCDILAVRTFAGLQNRDDDYQEKILSAFLEYSSVPVISLESATRHPLQSLADVLTIKETVKKHKPKVVLSWAPHPKALPQAVANSFLEWISKTDADLTITCPSGYELHPEFTQNISIENNQIEAFKEADVVYVKNWSSYNDYGAILPVNSDWMITKSKMSLTQNAAFMHCLPIRRNVIAEDSVIDRSLVYTQAENRIWAAQTVLSHLIEQL